MVNLGRSKGCNTCRQRRIKCDETKPTCQRCAAAGRACGGYERKIPPVKFKLIQTSESFVSKKGEGRILAMRPPQPKMSALVPALGIAEDDAALCFFIGNFANVGQDSLSTRGLFEMIQPVLNTESSGSAMSFSVATLSTCMYTRYRAWPGSPTSHLLGRALQQLQADIEDPVKSRSDATLLATMVLQFHDKLSAVNKLRKVKRTHHDGAVALLRHRGKEVRESTYGRHLLGQVLRTMVASAIREKRPLTEDDLRWLDYEALPLGPSPALDLIGISIANLQHDFLSSTAEDRDSLKVEADTINTDLLDWMANIPTLWRPHRLEQIKECSSPIIAYNGLCDVYPSLQIGVILNIWRCYRLIVLRISLALQQRTQSPQSYSIDEYGGSTNPEKEGIRSAVDGICATVPFFLGNRHGPGTISDFTHPSLAYPSYHDVPLELRPTADDLIPQEEHNRHAIAQGMWHVMSSLGHVVSLYSDAQVMGCLGEGQMMWLRGQLGRTGVIMRLDMSKLRGGGKRGLEKGGGERLSE